ncbi:glycosyltransferase family 2 protein [Patiriisocius hiemis]|uniref:Glycosyltransferase family 2 protein n=1 Tax=Patiriisocius hiemis TaxID=3075604 RepID=A0ABU2YDF9_9FLAO|nr:glycosyltransferase family 2 protein [Constantimarinum sp. W242]MDT0556032.1 glycosyltransferase family 2 protein [Constantimarinum sp. W242]
MSLLSIITVNYNNANGLQRTIDSVINQQCDWVEFIVIDGCSSDNSSSILKKNDAEIAFWVSEKDNGIYHAMNKGISHATGEYILFLNSGDHFYDTDSLKNSKQFLNTYDILAFDIEVIHENKKIIKQHPDLVQFSYLYNNTFAHQSTIIKRTLFSKVGVYDESLKIVADWKFFMDALSKYNVSYSAIHKTLTTYYLDGISATGTGTNQRKKERREILEKEYGLFNNDYEQLNLMQTNRFKILRALEKSKMGRKLLSVLLRIFLFIFKGKQLKDL